MAILEVKGLCKRFGGLEVLNGIDLTLDQGQVLSIIGSSGSGKTTLLRCLNFLERPDAGELYVAGQELWGPACTQPLRQRRLHFGLVFQNFNLFPQYTVLRNVTLAMDLLAKERRGKSAARQASAENEQKARELLGRVGLADKLQNYPFQLSGGQQQRVAIARALAAKPAILLADEPTGNLDSKTSLEVLGLLKRSGRQFHQTIVMITHNEEIAQMADRILRIEDGRLVGGEGR